MISETITLAPPGSDLTLLAHKLRWEVFVHEQHVPAEMEYDQHDLTAPHYVSLLGGNVVGALRVIALPGRDKISRFVVHRAYRRQGVGRRMLEHVIADLAREGRVRLYLEAQVSAIGFYQRLGFRAYGEQFLEAGIPHRRMVNYELSSEQPPS